MPMQIAFKLGVALYAIFPLVSELASEIAHGVYMKPSQVRIMGANADDQDSERTVALIGLVPFGEIFDDFIAHLTAERLWLKQVSIKSSLFGDYEVLYVKYPGLPPSPPLPSSTVGTNGGSRGCDNNGMTEKPLGVDVSKHRHGLKLNGGIIAIIVLSAAVVAVLFGALVWVLLFKRRDGSRLEPASPAVLPSFEKSSGIAASTARSGPASRLFRSTKTFSLTEIEKATNNFNESGILGEGGFGVVYSGLLDDGTRVAVKVLKRIGKHGDREFLAEVEMLSRLHHRNLVRLIGFCKDDRSRCLIYELIPNGSVQSHLHGKDKETGRLGWAVRLKIALGAARGLAYLHEDSSPRVIHRDFKSSNILLEHDFTPKVSDFGLAPSALDEENRHITIRIMGTFGYLAPEYAMTGHLLVKSDVYSYGVVLLELLTERKPVDMSMPPGQENLAAWAQPLLMAQEGLPLLIDPMLVPDAPFDSMAKVAAVASMCVQTDVSNRPSMGQVVQALNLVFSECEEPTDLGSTYVDHHAWVGPAQPTYSNGGSPLGLESGSGSGSWVHTG